MRLLSLVIAACAAPLCAGAALASHPGLSHLPSAVAIATPGTGSAPVLSAGVAGGAALMAMTRKRSARRARL